MSCLETAEPPPGFRHCVGILLLNRQGLAFVGQRRDAEGDAWQMPQGGIDRGEVPAVAARREMLEEIGSNRAELLQESGIWRSYDLPAELAGRLWRGRYRGQTQRWLAFRFIGSDADIDLDGAHPEFSAWRWVPPDDLPQLIVPFKRDVYVSVVAEFRHLWA